MWNKSKELVRNIRNWKDKTDISRSSCNLIENISLESSSKYNVETYAATIQTSMTECFAKIVKSKGVNHFQKKLYLICLTGFWTRLYNQNNSQGCAWMEWYAHQIITYKIRNKNFWFWSLLYNFSYWRIIRLAVQRPGKWLPIVKLQVSV